MQIFDSYKDSSIQIVPFYYREGS